MGRFEARLAPVLRGFMAQGVPGCSLLVLRRGETLYETHLGYADVESQKPVTQDTIFRIYSMSKIITCTAALMLYERGLYALNDPLHDYLPEFKDPQVLHTAANGVQYTSPAANPIRVRDLFTMASGYPYPGEDTETGRRLIKAQEALESGGFTARGDPALRSFTKALAAIPLAFEPGTHWLYGLSHDILGALIEVLSGKTFGRFLEDEIFKPLGMAGTSFCLRQDQWSRLCGLYERAGDGTVQKNTRMDAGFVPGAPFESGGGGLLSTLSDYGRFAQVLAMGGEAYGVRLLSPHTVKLMASNHLTGALMQDFSRGQSTGYGYGLGVRVMLDPPAGGAFSPGEFGWAGMAGTFVYMDPAEQLSAVFMKQFLPNRETNHITVLRNAIYGAL